MILGVIPGPKKPKSLEDFFQPLIRELFLLQEKGMIMTTEYGQYEARVHSMLTGEIFLLSVILFVAAILKLWLPNVYNSWCVW